MIDIISNPIKSKFEITGVEMIHQHTDFSLLDGYAQVEELASRAKQINQQYLCVTDHGAMGSVPRQIRTAEKNKLNPIFGIELYVNPLQPEIKQGETSAAFYKDLDAEQKQIFRKSYHLLAIAYNEIGYSNLVQLSSWGWLKGFYYKPRVNHEQLMAHKEGIIFTSCCYNGEIGQAFERGGEQVAEAMLCKYMAMFGDKFYLELMLLDFTKQKPFDAFLIKMHDKYHVPLIITNDVHYAQQADSHMQRLMLMIQTGRTIQDIQKLQADEEGVDLFELQDQNLWMKSEDELNEKWSKDYSHIIDYELFKQAKANTVSVCEFAKGVKLDRTLKLPQFPDANEQLKEAALKGFINRRLPATKEYKSRLIEELSLIIQKDFASYFIIQKMISEEAVRIAPKILGFGDGTEALGPGRGSVCASLVAYCIGITDVDPIEHDLLFSRFLSPARGGKSLKLEFDEEPIYLDKSA